MAEWTLAKALLLAAALLKFLAEVAAILIPR